MGGFTLTPKNPYSHWELLFLQQRYHQFCQWGIIFPELSLLLSSKRYFRAHSIQEYWYLHVWKKNFRFQKILVQKHPLYCNKDDWRWWKSNPSPWIAIGRENKLWQFQVSVNQRPKSSKFLTQLQVIFYTSNKHFEQPFK